RATAPYFAYRGSRGRTAFALFTGQTRWRGLNKTGARALEQHVDPMDLARLAEGRLPESTRDRIVGHLAGCPRCTAIYAEVVEAHLDSSSEKLDTPGDDWIRAGVEAGPRAWVKLTAAPKHRPRPRFVLGTAVIAASMIVVGALILRARFFQPVQL